MSKPNSQTLEANLILDELVIHIPKVIDGISAVETMRKEGSRNWRQMEWIGFWLEHLVETKIVPSVGGNTGPRYGKTVFDLQRKHVWDLKVHLDGSDWLILNDREAVNFCIKDNSGIGYLIVEGSAEFDVDGTFKKWHDEQKGAQSSYEVERIQRGAPSRRRKKIFFPKRLTSLWIPSLGDLATGDKDGWLKGFQKGMRNSNGILRREKFQIKVNEVPNNYILLDRLL